MRLWLTVVIVVIGSIPALLAGAPGLAPGWFSHPLFGAAAGVVALSLLIVLMIGISQLCARVAARHDEDAAR